MVVRIRLSRFGNKHQPFFNIIVAQARYVSLVFLLFFPSFEASTMCNPNIPIYTTYLSSKY